MKEAPWSDTTTLKLANKEERLSMEIKQFEQYISPTIDELSQRKKVQKAFEDFVAANLPGSTAVPFGSHVTGLYLPGSDMDLDVRGGQANYPKSAAQRLKKALLKQRMCSYDQLNYVPMAKVPVLTVDSPRYPISVDITFDNPSPSSDRTIFWVKKHPALRPLYLVLKHALLALQHPRPTFKPMSSKFCGMASYALVCLIVNFLEVEAEKRGCIPSTPTYYANLLIEFLSFYSSFDFAKTGIQFFEKKSYFSKGNKPPMMILDPDVPDSNVGRSTSCVGELQECFTFLLDTVISKQDHGPANSILQRIIPITHRTPSSGARRYEGRDYEIAPLNMIHSDILRERQMEQSIKTRKRMERRQEKRAKKNHEADGNAVLRSGIMRIVYDDDDTGYSSSTKNSNKRKRSRGDDPSFDTPKRTHTRW